jgi:hypothetical protein
MKNLNILTISVLLVGCGGGSFTGSADQMNIAGGTVMSEAGTNDGVAGNSSGGSANNAGSSGVENTAGQSFGGMNTAGTSFGGENNIAGDSSGTGGSNNIAGFNSAGNGGSAGEIQTCTPTTCNDIAIMRSSPTYNALSCGNVDDGCGHILNCGTCADVYSGCGVANYTAGTSMTGPSGTVTVQLTSMSTALPNICGGTCAIVANNENGMTVYDDENRAYPYTFLCRNFPTDYMTNPPGPNCIFGRSISTAQQIFYCKNPNLL